MSKVTQEQIEAGRRYLFGFGIDDMDDGEISGFYLAMKAKEQPTTPASELVGRLRTRADIRRRIPDRKSVVEGKPDRIADLLDEAADEIERLLAAIHEIEALCHSETRQRLLGICQRAMGDGRQG